MDALSAIMVGILGLVLIVIGTWFGVMVGKLIDKLNKDKKETKG